MKPKLLRWAGTLATALVLTYAGTVAITEVQEFAVWRVNILWFCVLAGICGAMLALIGNHAFLSMTLASALASLMVAGVGSYILYSFLGEHFSYSQILLSNPFTLHIVPRSAIVFLVSLPFGFLAIIIVFLLIGTD